MFNKEDLLIVNQYFKKYLQNYHAKITLQTVKDYYSAIIYNKEYTKVKNCIKKLTKNESLELNFKDLKFYLKKWNYTNYGVK